MRTLNILLLVTSPAIFLGLTILFLLRGLIRQFPYFFSYMVYSIVVTVLRRALMYNQRVYFWTYWATDFIYDVLAFMTMREVFRRVFPPAYPTFRSLRWLLPTTTVVLLGMSLYATFHNPPAGVARIVGGIQWFNVGIHCVEGVFLPLVIILILAFAVPWPQYEVGILVGFGVSAYSIMFFFLLRIQGGSRYDTWYTYGPPVGFTVATLIWLWTFIQRPATDKPAPSVSQNETA